MAVTDLVPVVIVLVYAIALTLMPTGRMVPAFAIGMWALVGLVTAYTYIWQIYDTAWYLGVLAVLLGAVTWLCFLLFLAGGAYWFFGRLLARDWRGSLASVVVIVTAFYSVIAIGKNMWEAIF